MGLLLFQVQSLKDQTKVAAELGLHVEDDRDPFVSYTRENGQKGMREAAARYLIEKHIQQQRQNQHEQSEARRAQNAKEHKAKLSQMGFTTPQAAFASMRRSKSTIPRMDAPPDTPRGPGRS